MFERSSLRRAGGHAIVGVAQLAAAAGALATTRFDGGLAFVWVATAILVARLVVLPTRRWAPAIVISIAISIGTTGLLGLGWRAAPAMAAVNLAEALIGAMLLRRITRGHDLLNSLAWLVRFVASVGVAGPAASGIGAALVSGWVTGHPIAQSWLQWFTGHALGGITFTPIALFLLRGDVRRWTRDATSRHAGETLVLLALVTATAVGVFGQHRLPLLFLPMLPVMLATFRAGRLAAAVSIVILALVGGWYTAHGLGPIGLMQAGAGPRMQFLQFYLAATVLTVLPIAADLAHRAGLFLRMRESEARYRLLADHSTDIIMNLDPNGCIRFVSPSIRQLTGREPEALIGQQVADLIDPEDRARAAEAHVAALRARGATIATEFRASLVTGERRWFETLTRAIVRDDGRVDGVVNVTRDISGRKALEGRLKEQASTDALTGIANRRALMAALDAALDVARASGGGGCLAIFDLDHFKQVNDLHGHDAGDAVIRAFANTARALVRSGDLVARMGGEEFAVMLPGASVAQATIVCDRVREQFAAMPMAFDGKVLRASASGGVASFSDSEDCAALLKAADDALYRAKEAGRNRLVIA